MNKNILRVLIALSIIISAASCFFILHYNITKQITWCFGLNFKSSKITMKTIYANISLFIGIFFTIHVLSVIIIRIVRIKVLPYQGEEPELILCLNRIISNSVEEIFIFGSLLYAVQELQPVKWPIINFVHLARLFIFGRVIYCFGYLFNHFTGLPYLRSFGFALTIFNSITIILAFLKVDVFELLKQGPFNDL